MQVNVSDISSVAGLKLPPVPQLGLYHSYNYEPKDAKASTPRLHNFSINKYSSWASASGHMGWRWGGVPYHHMQTQNWAKYCSNCLIDNRQWGLTPAGREHGRWSLLHPRKHREVAPEQRATVALNKQIRRRTAKAAEFNFLFKTAFHVLWVSLQPATETKMTDFFFYFLL